MPAVHDLPRLQPPPANTIAVAWRDWQFAGIYGIRHIESQKIYVGQSQNIARRIVRHHHMCHNPYLRRAIAKHGWDAFEEVILERVDDLALLNEREQYWIDLYDATNPEKGYNLSPTAGSTRGLHLSDEARAKRSASRKGVSFSPEHCAALRAANNRPEVKAKNSAAQKIIQNLPDVRAAKSAALRGVPLTPEHRAALTAAANRPEVKAAKSAKLKNTPKSPAHCAALSAAGKIAQNRPETKKKRSASLTGVPKTSSAHANMRAAQNRPEVRASKRMKMILFWARKRAISRVTETSTQLRLFGDDAPRVPADVDPAWT